VLVVLLANSKERRLGKAFVAMDQQWASRLVLSRGVLWACGWVHAWECAWANRLEKALDGKWDRLMELVTAFWLESEMDELLVALEHWLVLLEQWLAQVFGVLGTQMETLWVTLLDSLNITEQQQTWRMRTACRLTVPVVAFRMFEYSMESRY